MILHNQQRVVIKYTNWRHETSFRTIIPQKIWFGSTDWHPQAQWLLDAHDLEKDAHRSFALADIKEWRQL